MTRHLTFTIIKPDAVKANNIGNILKMITDYGFKIRTMKMLQLSEDRAEDFYYEHKGRSYFDSLVKFMTSGPVVVAVLEGLEAVADYRQLMGATAVGNRLPGTIRHAYGTGLMENAVHGSDSIDNAEREIEFFFSPTEIF